MNRGGAGANGAGGYACEHDGMADGGGAVGHNLQRRRDFAGGDEGNAAEGAAGGLHDRGAGRDVGLISKADQCDVAV